MREIKFRGYDLNREEWRYGSLDRDLEQNEYYITDEYEGVGKNVEEDSIGQYTGLKDKNGVEIYEGDIVKINAHSYDYGFSKDRIGEIRFLEGCFGFYQQLSEKEYLFNELTTESGYGELEYYEVIGNIYDNPELIEKEGKVNE